MRYILLSILFFTLRAEAQWENISWQAEIPTNAFRAGDALFIRTGPSYIYRSRNEGKTWQLFTSGLGPHIVAYEDYFTATNIRYPSTLTTDGVYVYLYLNGHSPDWQRAFGSGVFRARFDDEAWSFLPNGSLSSGSPHGGYCSFSRDSVFRWEWSPTGTMLLFTTDRGQSWDERRFGFIDPLRLVSSHRLSDRIVINPNLAVPEDRRSQLLNGIYYSTDFGEHWIQGGIRHPGSYVGVGDRNRISILFADDSLMLVQTDNYFTGFDLLRSVDRGLTFDTIGSPVPLYSNPNHVIVRMDSFIYWIANGIGKVYISSNKGTTWSPMPLTNTSNDRVSGIVPFHDKVLVAVENKGYYQYSPDLTSGTPYQTGTVAAFDSELKLVSGSTLIASSNIYNSPIHVSQDHGSTWKEVYFDSNFETPPGQWAEANGILYGVVFNGSYAVYRSLDKGNTWGILQTFPNKNPLYSVTASGDNILVSGSMNGFYHALSTDRGATWDTTLYKKSPLGVAKVFLVGPDLIGVHAKEGTALEPIFRSTDNGNSWQDITYDLPDSLLIYGITKIGDRFVVYSKSINYPDNRTRPVNYVLDPATMHWQPSTSGLCYRCEMKTIVPDGDKLFALVTNYWTMPPLRPGALIYFSRDSGITWHLTADGMISAHRIAIGSDYIYHDQNVITGAVNGSIFRYDLIKADVAANENAQTLSITNVICDERLLQFDLRSPVNSKGNLRLYDILGRLLYEQSIVFTVGKQTISIDSPDLRSGPYVMEVSTSDHHASKQLRITR